MPWYCLDTSIPLTRTQKCSLVLLVVALLTGLVSCSVEKRLCRNGYYWNASRQTRNVEQGLCPEQTLYLTKSKQPCDSVLEQQTAQQTIHGTDTIAQTSSSLGVVSFNNPDDTISKSSSRSEIKAIPPVLEPLKREDVHRFRRSSFTVFWLSLVSLIIMIFGGIASSLPLYMTGLVLAGVLGCLIIYLALQLYRLRKQFPELTRSNSAPEEGTLGSPYLKQGNKEDEELRLLRKAKSQAYWLLLASYLSIGVGMIAGLVIAYS